MRLYLDTMVWIYFYEGQASHRPELRTLFMSVAHSDSSFVASDLLLAELLVAPKRQGDLFSAARYRRLFAPGNMLLASMTRDVAERFSDLRASSRVKPADALHLALAASASVDYFVTYDQKLHALTLPGIGRVCSPDAVA